jgi:hypothetical protein
MKTNIKALKLVEKGLSSNTVSKLTESQINILYSKLLGEQVTEVPNKKTYKIGPKGGQVDGVVISQDPSTKEVTVMTKESELGEDDDFDLDADQAYTGQQGSHDADQPADDGMDDDTSPQNHDSKMIGMSEEKDGEPNPYSICHAQVGPKKTRKFERCVMSVKKQLKEGKNPVSLFLESQIEKIVERNMPPKITKGDLIKYIVEASPAPAPTTKPAPTKPGTKPGKRPNPFKNPNPGENPAPKAKKVSPEDAKEKVIDVIMQLLEK